MAVAGLDEARFYRRYGFVELRRDRPELTGWPDQVWMAHRRDRVRREPA